MIAWLRTLTPHRLAQLAIGLEWLVLARTFGESYWLRATLGPSFGLDAAMTWLTGALIALAFLGLSILLYFSGRDRLAGAAALVMVAILLVYKLVAIGLG